MRFIFDFLRDSGLEVYFPGKHIGICKYPYVVIRPGSVIPKIGTNQVGKEIIDLIIFAPVSSFVSACDFSEEVKEKVRGMSFLRRSGVETSWIVDDEKKAYTKSIEYELLKRLEE